VTAPHPLDNPVRSSLAGPHARFAERRGNVLRYPDDVCPFLALPDRPGSADWADAAALVGPGGLLPLAGVLAAPPAGWWRLADAHGESLSHLALSGSAQPFAQAVQAARPHPGQAATALRLRELLGADATAPGARVQDPYGLRALPQVHDPAADALGHLDRVLRTERLPADDEDHPLGEEALGQESDLVEGHAASVAGR
jgi:hypothetical protein